MMQIFVKTPTGRTLPLEVGISASVNDLKSMIRAREGIPVSLQKFVFSGKLLADDKTLSDSKIQKECTIQLCLGLMGGEKIRLIIKTLMGNITYVDAGASDSVDSVLDLIKEQQGYPIEYMRLVFHGMVLEKGRALFDYQLENDDIILLIIPLGPGG